MKKDKDNSVILPNPKIDYMFDEKDNYWKIKTPQGKVVGFSFVGLQEKLVERLKEFVYSSLHDTTKSKILTIYSDYLAIKDFLIFYNKDIEDINYFSSFHISCI